jgi:polyhydroxybutyrate depolymerase
VKYRLVLFSLLFLPILCFGQQTINDTILYDGLQRAYILYVPVSYNANNATPLIFNFHGYTSDAITQMDYGDFRQIADTAGFIIAHPMGTVDNNGNTHFNVGWGSSTVDDVGFTEALIDSIASAYNIDLNRVYATGMSNGGFMSFSLACQLSHKIAAIASVTGSMSTFQINNCSPVRPFPILQIHGTADPIVPYSGFNLGESIEDVLQYWINQNNCDSIPVITALPNIIVIDLSTVEHFVYPNCDSSSAVEHFKVNGGGHTWPGSSINIPITNYDMDASIEIWKFFLRFTLNTLSVGTTTPEFEQKIKVYPNPVKNTFFIEGLTEYTEYNLYNSLGHELLNGTLSYPNAHIHVSKLENGLYLLKIKNLIFKILK